MWLKVTLYLCRLYRDTTVQSLTLQPNVQDGVIVYEDSPLVSNHAKNWFLVILYTWWTSDMVRRSEMVVTIGTTIAPKFCNISLVFSLQVRAVKFGHVLVVDEADKAPTHVTCILKSLVESGVMVLGDGRRIVTGTWNILYLLLNFTGVHIVFIKNFNH